MHNCEDITLNETGQPQKDKCLWLHLYKVLREIKLRDKVEHQGPGVGEIKLRDKIEHQGPGVGVDKGEL